MNKNFSAFFLFSVLVLGLIINPSVFPNSFAADTLDSDFNLEIFAYAQETEDTIETIDFQQIQDELSEFVSKARIAFEEQKEETRALIAEYRESMATADPSEYEDIKQQFKEDRKAIKDAFKESRKTYKDSFKQFRESMKIAIKESKGLDVSDSDREDAIKQIKLMKSEAKAEIKELRKNIQNELKSDRKQIRDQLKAERDAVRDQKRADRDAMKEEKKAERDAMKEEKKAERDAMKEEKKADPDADTEAES